jgi:hypothetical protein
MPLYHQRRSRDLGGKRVLESAYDVQAQSTALEIDQDPGNYRVSRA